MVNYTQDNIPGMDAAIARSQQQNIDIEARQAHLSRQFARFAKYASFSKDPKFVARCQEQQRCLAAMMDHVKE